MALGLWSILTDIVCRGVLKDVKRPHTNTVVGYKWFCFSSETMQLSFGTLESLSYIIKWKSFWDECLDVHIYFWDLRKWGCILWPAAFAICFIWFTVCRCSKSVCIGSKGHRVYVQTNTCTVCPVKWTHRNSIFLELLADRTPTVLLFQSHVPLFIFPHQMRTAVRERQTAGHPETAFVRVERV